MVGAGVSLSQGEGSIQAGAAEVEGFDGQPEITGTGELAAQSSVTAGVGTVSGQINNDYASELPLRRPPALSIVGQGQLRAGAAGAATLKGAGEVSWDDHNQAALLLLAA